MSVTKNQGAPGVPDFLTLPEAAQILRISARTVRRRVDDGTLPTSRASRRLLIPRSAILAYLDATSRPATTGPLAGRWA